MWALFGKRLSMAMAFDLPAKSCFSICRRIRQGHCSRGSPQLSLNAHFRQSCGTVCNEAELLRRVPVSSRTERTERAFGHAGIRTLFARGSRQLFTSRMTLPLFKAMGSTSSGITHTEQIQPFSSIPLTRWRHEGSTGMLILITELYSSAHVRSLATFS